MEEQIIIRHHRVIGTQIDVLVAWEPATWYSHSTVTYIDDVLHGRVGTRRIPAEIDALDRGEERTNAVWEWYAKSQEAAHRAIEAHPLFAEIGRGRTPHYELSEIEFYGEE